MNSPMDEMTLLRQAQRHHHHQHLMVREMGEEIDLEMGPGDDDPTFGHTAPVLVAGLPQDHPDDHKQLLLTDHGELAAKLHQHHQQQQQQQQALQQPQRKKKKVVKKWRDEWADTYKWAYVDVYEGTTRIFCSVCKEYGRKHRRNPYGNEGSRNMQMSALEEHNNSLLHKEALRLQAASKDKSISSLERPIYVKGNQDLLASSERCVLPADEFLCSRALDSGVQIRTALLCKSAESIVEAVIRKDPHEVEFIQAVQEIVHSLEPVLSKTPQYVHILERLLEPERVIIFRVPWVDDKGETHINRGFRVQFSQALGPCRGGLRYHPSTTLSVAKFLGLEQTLKNALSRYRFGGAAGGSDFDPKGKSDNEIMRFCQSFMEELYRHLGPTQDLPAEDMGVGPREMNYLFGQYRRLAGHFEGNFIGPRNCWTGSALRTEATGYGVVYFAQMILIHMDRQLKGLRCVVSGAGKIAMHVLEKLLAFGAVPITISDSRGYLLDEDGFDLVKLDLLKQIKVQQRSLREYLKTYSRAKYFDEAKPWSEQCDIAFPCATHNELNHADALNLVNTGCRILIEGSNMPCTAEAVDVLRKYKVLVGPAKAATAGGVGIAELEAYQDGNLIHCSPEEIVQESMKHIYDLSIKTAIDYGFLKENPECLIHGGNIAAFLNIARAMIDQGCV